jgi:hypothetical protein
MEFRLFDLEDAEMTPEDLENYLDETLSREMFAHVQLRNNRLFLDDGTLIIIMTPNEGEIAVPVDICEEEEHALIATAIGTIAERTDSVITLQI